MPRSWEDARAADEEERRDQGRGIVRKRRTLYIIGPTRMHLDRVEGLGDFVELEVVLSDEQDTGDGSAIARRLMAELGIRPSRVVERAYIDLLEQGRSDPERGADSCRD